MTGWMAAFGLSIILAAELRRGGRLRRLRTLLHGVAGRRFDLRAALLLVAASALAGASSVSERAKPVRRWTADPELVLALDLSGSMAVADVSPNRAVRAYLAAQQLVGEVAGVRVGLVGFADRARLLLPPTLDRALLTDDLDALGAGGGAAAAGSDLADALGVAVAAFAPVPEGAAAGRRSIVMLSDMEGFEDRGRRADAIREAHEAGVRVHVLMVGSRAGGLVPGAGAKARSAVDPRRAEEIAGGTGGLALDLSDPTALARVRDAVAAVSADPDSETAPGDHNLGVLGLAAIALVGLSTEAALGLRARRLT
jgi:Ca-activated chloride channel homolog